MTHPATWKDWIIQSEACLEAHTQPGSCVGSDGPFILAVLGLALVLWLVIHIAAKAAK